MAKRKKIFTYGGVEIQGIYEEVVRKNKKIDHIRYYFFNEKGSKVRAREKNDIVKAYNEFNESQGDKNLIPIIHHVVKEKYALYSETTPMDYEPGGRLYDPDFPDYEPEYYDQIYALFPHVDRNFLLMHFGKMLEEDPKKLAQELGKEELSYLPRLKPENRYVNFRTFY